MYIPFYPRNPFGYGRHALPKSAHDLAPSQMEYTIRHMVVFNSKAYANI